MPLVPLLLTLCATACALAQVTPDPEPPDRPQVVPTEGFWPTRLMVQRWIDRMAEEFAEEYELDPDQQDQVRRLWQERFPAWLNQNRAAIMHVTNELIEAVLIEQEPTAEAVADWARRVKPILSGFSELVEKSAEEMKPLLTEDQALRLDNDLEMFRYGLGNVNERLDTWIAGGFDPENEWPYRVAEREAREAVERRAEAERDAALPDHDAAVAAAGETAPSAASRPVSQPAAREEEKDEWTLYTEKFIARYRLSAEQEQKARLFLRQARDGRRDYLNRRRREHEALQAAVREAATEEQRAAAKEKLAGFEKPLERMFERLKEKLDTLPTRAQRKEAAEREAASPR